MRSAITPAYDRGVSDTQGDTNTLAIDRAELSPEVAAWLREVNGQVVPRLDRVAPDWRDVDQPEVVEACAFGLLIGYLAEQYPEMAPDLARVADQHPSFTSLPEGRRLQTLRVLASDPARAASWIGPLIGVEDPEQVRLLFD
jgi:hypothetical protein